MAEVEAQPREAQLTEPQVRHVAQLCRLRLSDEQVQRYRTQLSSILAYMRKLDEFGEALVGAEADHGDAKAGPPTPASNRLDADEVGPMLSRETLLALAPVIEGEHIAVPRVLESES